MEQDDTRVASLPYTSFRASGSSYLLTRSESRIEHRRLFREVKEDGYSDFINFDEALEKAGTGRFQFVLFLVCGLIYMSCSVNAGIMGFILPASKCHLNITYHERGVVFSSDLVGNAFGTFIWGAIADTKGRRVALLISQGIQTVTALLTTFSFHKYMLIVSRFGNGFGSIGSASVVFAYSSDFVVPKYKDHFLSILEMFWAVGMILIPVMAVLILPLRVNRDIGFTTFESWNLYSLLHTVLPFVSLILLLFLPESPEFLLYQRQAGASLNVLAKVFVFNKGRDSKFNVYLSGVSESTLYIRKEPEVMDYLKQIFVQTAKLLRGKYKSRFLKICLISLLVNFSYLTVSIWIPTLLERHDYIMKMNGSEKTFCGAAMEVGQFLEVEAPCSAEIPKGVFGDAIIISCSVLPFTAALFFSLNYFGRNELLIVITVMAGVSCLMICSVVDRTAITVFCSLFEASADIIETMLFLFVVHLFPGTICGIALSMTVACGRVGAVFGNTLFGALVDKHCYFPMYAFAAAILGSVFIELTIPRIEIWD